MTKHASSRSLYLRNRQTIVDTYAVTLRSCSVIDWGHGTVLVYRIPGGIEVKTSEAFQNRFRHERVCMRGNLDVLTNDTRWLGWAHAP